jgi:hypothetical protein
MDLEQVKAKIREQVACGCCVINEEAVERVATFLVETYYDERDVPFGFQRLDVMYNFVVRDRGLKIEVVDA